MYLFNYKLSHMVSSISNITQMSHKHPEFEGQIQAQTLSHSLKYTHHHTNVT